MAKLEPIIVFLFSALLFFSWVPASHSAKKPVSIARKEDIPYIKCQVCEKLANQLYQLVKKKEAQISPKKVSEFQIIEISENVCNLKKEEADWILRIDIVKKGNGLEDQVRWTKHMGKIGEHICLSTDIATIALVEQDTEGQCNSQCKTIEKACQEVMGYSDTDVAEYMYISKPQIDSLVNFLCNDLTKACFVKPPPLPKDWTPGEPFVAKSSKEAEMEKMLRSMEGMPGAPGMKMYSKEDLLNLPKLGDEDSDEEDDDNEGNFPSNLGKVLREKETTKLDWKQRVIQGFGDTRTALKRHANNVSGRLRKWWGGKKTAGSKGSKAEL